MRTARCCGPRGSSDDEEVTRPVREYLDALDMAAASENANAIAADNAILGLP